MKIVDATGLVSIKIVGAIGLDGLWALGWAWRAVWSVCGRGNLFFGSIEGIDDTNTFQQKFLTNTYQLKF